jgi:hypothetical protein
VPAAAVVGTRHRGRLTTVASYPSPAGASAEPQISRVALLCELGVVDVAPPPAAVEVAPPQVPADGQGAARRQYPD